MGDETITFNKDESVVVYTGDDGSFNLQDYGKVCAFYRVRRHNH